MPILPLMKYDIRRVGARPPTQPRYLRLLTRGYAVMQTATFRYRLGCAE